MKKIAILIVGLFLTLQSLPLYSEESNTKEFSIEGIRIGDRADDHFTGRELAMAISNEFNHLSNIGFYVHNFRNKKPINNYDYAFKEYDYVRIITKQDDGRLFYVHGVTALMRYEDINECYSKHDKIVKELADHIIEIPESLELLSPMLTTIPLQLLSYHIAVLLGKNVDQPRNLAKSVTVE